MAAPLKKRRRSPWIVLGVALVLLLGVRFNMRARGLNAMERSLVGYWRSEDEHDPMHLYLGSDRRWAFTNATFSRTYEEGTSWRASPEILTLGVAWDFRSVAWIPGADQFASYFSPNCGYETPFRIDRERRLLMYKTTFGRVSDADVIELRESAR